MNLLFSFVQRYASYVLGSVVLLLLFFTVFAERGVFHLWRLRTEKWKLDERNYFLQKENEALRQRISRLRHDDTYLEKLAREELNLVRPGEVVYRFPRSAPNAVGGGANATPSERPPSAGQKERR